MVINFILLFLGHMSTHEGLSKLCNSQNGELAIDEGKQLCPRFSHIWVPKGRGACDGFKV